MCGDPNEVGTGTLAQLHHKQPSWPLPHAPNQAGDLLWEKLKPSFQSAKPGQEGYMWQCPSSLRLSLNSVLQLGL